MAAFVEALLKQRLWYWLESEREMSVEGEVSLGTGRIDLVAETPNGRYIGVEVKPAGLSVGGEEFEQLHRYIESGALDELYFASRKIDSIRAAVREEPSIGRDPLARTCRQLRAGIQSGRYSTANVRDRLTTELPEELLDRHISGNWKTVREYTFDKIDQQGEESLTPISLEEGISRLKRVYCPPAIGIIHIPTNINIGGDDPDIYDLDRALDPDNAYAPRIVRNGDDLERTTEPTFNRVGEPWVRHCVWAEYGGLPEGYIPNVVESDQPYRPIDILAFSGSYDPTVVLERTDEAEVIGVEAKGNYSFDPDRIVEQLIGFLNTNTLTRLYLAVPEVFSNRATKLVTDTPALTERVGILTVDEQGHVETVKEAPQLEMQHDGYIHRHSVMKIGYGSLSIEDGREVVNPFITDEEKDRLTNSDAGAYATDLLSDNSAFADDDGWIQYDLPDETRPPESEYEKINNTTKTARGDAIRSYLLRGKSADPYGPHGEEPIPKEGYVRLRIEELDVDDDFAIKLHFGRGSNEGGYIWFVGSEVTALSNVLVSLNTISGGIVPGQGKLIDLTTYPFDHEENRAHKLTGEYGNEQILPLRIKAGPSVAQKAIFQLGEESHQGVEVTLSEPQWLDLIATIDILRNGNHRQLPGEYGSNPRIGPNGTDTWSLGSDIETEANPGPLSEWRS
jgi:hypothetical protein